MEDTQKLGLHAAKLMEELPDLPNGEISAVMTIVVMKYGENHEHFYCHIATTENEFHSKLGLVETARVAIMATTPIRPGTPEEGDS